MLQGFSSFAPSSLVFGSIEEKVNVPAIASFPAVGGVSQPLAIPRNLSLPISGPEMSQFSSTVACASRPVSIPTPKEAFFVVDLDCVRRKYALWQECFPNVVPHYAVKANPNPAILSLMANELKINFDCASKSEIEAVLAEGCDPSRIIFANPCKSMGDIDYARRVGVLRTTFDSESELYKIKAVHPRAELVLRIWVDDSEAQCQLSNKYGAHLVEAVDLFKLAKELDLNIMGVSFHVGSGGSAKSYSNALTTARHAFKAGLDLGHHMTLLDIGGGFPGTDSSPMDHTLVPAGPCGLVKDEAVDAVMAATSNAPATTSQTTSLAEISKLMKPYFDRDWEGVQLIAEPGRFFCSESQTLATQVIGKRVRSPASSGRSSSMEFRREYYINDGLYQSFNSMLYDHSVLLADSHVKEGEMKYVQKFPSVLFGQTCDGLDTICKHIMLPDLRVGDWLAVPGMGAYTNGASSQFNGFPLNNYVVLNSSPSMSITAD